MTEDQTIGLVASIMMLVLVGSSLAIRRLPASQFIKIALAWIAIFAVALAVVSLWLSWSGRDEIRLVPSEAPREEVVSLEPSAKPLRTLHNAYYRTERWRRADG